MKKTVIAIIAAVVIIAAALIVIPEIILRSNGFHDVFGRVSVNAEGTCYVYDMQTGEMTENVDFGIHDRINKKKGSVRSSLHIDGFIDVDALNAEGNGKVYVGWLGYFGDEKDMPYCITLHYGPGLDNPMDVPPYSYLVCDSERVVSVVMTYPQGAEREGTYIALFGFATKEAASSYYHEHLDLLKPASPAVTE